MPKARDTATDRLSNVIEVVELGRRTGLLSAERGSGGDFQDGEIYFVSGRPTYASLGYLRGREALAALGQWGACRFAFDTTVPAPVPNLSGTLGPLGPRPGGRGDAGSPSGPLPPPGTGRLGLGTPPGGPGSQPSGAFGAGPSSAPWSVPPQGAPPTGPLGRRPRRAPDIRDLMAVVTAHNLSRGHRTVLLLADGSHTIIDLARLASKSVDEVTQLLADLEALGLIYYYQ
jgi:hypothetical protein